MKYGLIGEKLGHSFSKVIHESFADYEYDLMPIAKENLHDFMTKREFKAINVTIPYKHDVIPYLSYIDEAAEKIGAVNTIVNRDGKLYGYNTDFGGLRKLILKNGFDFTGKKVLILGTGGTSKTAFAVAESLGACEIYNVGRKSEVNYDNVKTLHGDAEYIINTTPCGMFPNNDTAAISLDGFTALEGVTDVVYNPLKTKLVRQTESLGIKGCCGLYMLVSQAVLASEIFLGVKYDEQVYEDVYKKLLSQKQNIVLTGMPGCGKSTIGKALAEKLGKDFVDTDDLIVSSEGRQISDIFASFGEKYFRDTETAAIRDISGKNGYVIATGGGAVLRSENIDHLKSNGKIFFLNRPLDDIMPTDDRPLSSNFDDLKRRFEERYPIYISTADEEIAVDGIVENAVDRIIEKL
ncbi:MAG: AAA family ATPase [Faecalibacterium sp.]|nr:AAA family ATPase [Ruminococcus sp.]MCM1393220.1 AAA family ATPase [Ruminococcus sp.]MCM1485332.1 AAA family ATPase [Faecalibacterium sp.]